MAPGRDSNYVRTCRWHVHEPVQTLANSLISFRVPRKRKEMQANPLQRASRRSRDKGPDNSAAKVTAENCRFAGTSSTAYPQGTQSGPPVHLAVPENCCGLTLILAVFDRCGKGALAFSATGSATASFPRARGRLWRASRGQRDKGPDHSAAKASGGRFVNRPYGAQPGARRRSGFCRSFSCYSLFPYRHTSSPFSTSTVMVAPGVRSPRRMVRATRVSTLLCSTRRRGRAP